jgi:hypothetical protein
MSFFNARQSLKRVVTQVSVVGVVTIGAVALAHPAQAASLDLSTWGTFGDIKATATQAQLTNAVNPASGSGSDDYDAALNPINRNISGSNPVFVPPGVFEAFFVLPSGALGPNVIEGSVIQTVLDGVTAGDKLSFNWNFQTFDTVNIDRAFVAINNVINPIASNTATTLTGSSPFSYTFAGAGSYRVAIGVVDVGNAFSSSILTVNNANLTAVPTPALLPGLIALGLRMRAKRRQPAD